MRSRSYSSSRHSRLNRAARAPCLQTSGQALPQSLTSYVLAGLQQRLYSPMLAANKLLTKSSHVCSDFDIAQSYFVKSKSRVSATHVLPYSMHNVWSWKESSDYANVRAVSVVNLIVLHMCQLAASSTFPSTRLVRMLLLESGCTRGGLVLRCRASRKRSGRQQKSYTLDTKFWRDPGVANFKVRGANYLKVC